MLAAAGLFSMNPTVGLADTKSDLSSAKARLAGAKAELDAIATEYEALSTAQSATLDELNTIEKSVRSVKKRIKRTEKELVQKQQTLAQSVSDEYKDGSLGVVDLLMRAGSVEELISNLYYYGKITQEQANLIEDVKKTRERYVEQMTELEVQQVSLEEVSQTQAAHLESMREKQLEAQQLIDGLDKEVRKLIAKQDAELLAAQKEAEVSRTRREEAVRRATEESAAKEAASKQAAAKEAVEKEAAAKEEAEKAAAEKEAAENEAAEKEAAAKDAAAKDAAAKDAAAKEEAEKAAAQEAAQQEEQKNAQDATEDVASEAEPVEPEVVADDGAADMVDEGFATGSLEAVISSCFNTPSPGSGLCAGWCSNVMINAGYGFVNGNANDMYAEFCHSSDPADIRPGMAVAVSTHPHSSAGRIYGHIGMYIGDNTVMDNIGYIRSISLDEWCTYYGETVPARWGWLNNIVLM
jgi:peptidoglycan hydrolase CwlO-like protein